jgi:CRP/FNR family transcriptional regulator, anaerobic regulatory protein
LVYLVKSGDTIDGLACMIPLKPDNSSGPSPEGVACSDCSLDQLCLPVGVGIEDLDRLDGIVRRKRPLRRGDCLFRAGDPFRAVYAVRSGSLITCVGSEDGREHVTGFHLPGELVGLDAISTGSYPTTARALETSSICEVAYEDLAVLSRKIDGLQRQMMRLMSREIVQDREMMVLLGGLSAERRVAALLRNLARRFGQRGFSAQAFRLSMSRAEIGSYLGLALETVSRVFTRLQADGLLAVDRRQVRIVDPGRLDRLVDSGA